MKLVPLFIALWSGIVQLPSAWKRLNAYTKWAIIGFCVMIIGTSICDLLTHVIRNYTVRNQDYSQTVGDLVYYLVIDFCLMTWAIFIRHKCRFEKLPKCLMQLAIDYIFWDMLFLCISNPYEWNKSKILIYTFSTLTFIIIYYFEFISLWHLNWWRKLKDFYHEHIKKRK